MVSSFENFTSLGQPLLINNTIDFNNIGSITLNKSGTGITYIGVICGSLDGYSNVGPTNATNCIVNINNNQILDGYFNNIFGHLVNNVVIENCIFNYKTTTSNEFLTFTTPRPVPAQAVTYINSYTKIYNINSGSYYIPDTSGTILIGSQTISLESQLSPPSIIINGILYPIGTSYASSNLEYLYSIFVMGVGSMYFGLDISQIQQTISSLDECICQLNSCSTNPQTGITDNSRITNIKQDKTIRINVDREFATKSVVYPKFKSYSDYIKYVQAGLKY